MFNVLSSKNSILPMLWKCFEDRLAQIGQSMSSVCV